MTQPHSDWKEEVREYFDKTLKAKKPTMKNLDREIMVDFISSLLTRQKERMMAMGEGKKIKALTNNDLDGQFVKGYNYALTDTIQAIKEIEI